jgi:hypothetical protein
MINDFCCQLSRKGKEVKYQRFMILTTKEVLGRRGTKDANIPEGFLFSWPNNRSAGPCGTESTVYTMGTAQTNPETTQPGHNLNRVPNAPDPRQTG